MYCPKCGAKLAKEAVFCHKCGNKMPEELLNTEEAKEATENYETLFSYPTEIKEKESILSPRGAEKAVSDFLKLDPTAEEETPIISEINFDIPDDWDVVPEKKPTPKPAVSEFASTSSFDIPDDWESISEPASRSDSDNSEFSEADLNFEIPDDWNI